MLSAIVIASPGATIDDAWEAAELAGIADDIRKMPMGMHTIVTEGSGGISGGQRQRIMIARAVCGGKSILMFDEATSALDNKTQKHVSDSLERLGELLAEESSANILRCRVAVLLKVSEGRLALLEPGSGTVVKPLAEIRL